MDSNKRTGIRFATGGLYVLIIAVLGCISLFFNIYLAVAELLIAAVLFVVNYVFKRNSEKQIADMFEKMTLNIGSVTRNALMNFPLPTLIVQGDGKIKWYNDEYQQIFKQDHLYDVNVSELFPMLSVSKFLENPEKPFMETISFFDRHFRVFGSYSDSEGNRIIVLYFDEITEYVSFEEKYRNEKTFACFLFVDNYDELIESAESGSRPQLQGLLYKKINDWANSHGGVLNKYEKDKYSILFEQRCLESMLQDKFSILSDIRSIDEGNTIPAGISIGIGTGGATIAENDRFARDAINMALGRGGDQAVIKDHDQFRFYGGTTKEYEKSTRVKARVVSSALSGLISNAESVIVMGHKNTDVDCLGAAFGVYRLCRMQNKPVHILLESYDQTVKNMLDRLENVEEYAGIFLNAQQAMAMIKSSTLLVVVDTHKPALVECASLLNETDQIVVIDHHRRSTEFIENTALIYHEPYASSACEMMTEILQYSSDKLSLTKLEAECLYAGIVIDTKHFTFKTGVRTFEAASFLRKQGVDTVAIKTMFQQDLTSYVKRAMIIKDAKIYHDHIAVSTCEANEPNQQILIAQAADELLNIKGITASFVLSGTETGVSISGRSLGGFNVQVILEKLGGGGHMTIAGAQLSGVSLEEAESQLLQAIEEYYLDTAH